MGGKAHPTRGDLKDAPDTKGIGSHYSGGTQVPWGSERDGDCAWGDGASAWRLVETGGQKSCYWTSLVAQWLRIHLPMQETGVRALVREDPICRGATKPVRHNY